MSLRDTWQDAWTKRLIEARLPSWLARRVHARIGRDARWRARYDALRIAQGEWTPAQDSLALSLILDDKRLAESPSQTRAFLGFAAAAAALVLVVVIAPWNQQAETVLQARGTAGALGVRISCHAADAKIIGETTLSPGDGGPPLECVDDGSLSFILTNTRAEDAYVFVVGVREDGEVLWFSPFELEVESARLRAGSVALPLETVAGLGPMNLTGRVSLHALFSQRPLRGGEIADVLAGAGRRGLRIQSLDRLPLDEVSQSRALMAMRP